MGYVIAYFVIGLIIAFTVLVISHMPNHYYDKTELEILAFACTLVWPVAILLAISYIGGIHANKFSKTIAEKIIEYQRERQAKQEKINLKQNPSYRDSAKK